MINSSVRIVDTSRLHEHTQPICDFLSRSIFREVDHLCTFSADSRALAPVPLGSDGDFVVVSIVVALAVVVVLAAVVLVVAVVLTRCNGTLTLALHAGELLLDAACSPPCAQEAELLTRLFGREFIGVAIFEWDRRSRRRWALNDALDFEISCDEIRDCLFRDVVCPLLTAGTVLEPVGGEARLPVWVRNIDKRPRFYLRFGSEPEKKLVRSTLEVST